MTREDIIRMAHEAGLLPCYEVHDEDLERFAKLVAVAERDECAEVCLDIGKRFNDGKLRLEFNGCALAILTRGNS